MRVDIDNLHELGDLVERVDKHKGGALILIGGGCLILSLVLLGIYLAKH